MRLDIKNPVALGMSTVGIVLLAGTLAYTVVVPSPDPKAAVEPVMRDITKYKHEKQHAEEVKSKYAASTTNRLWVESDEKIAPKALKMLTALADKHALKVSSFRPQKGINAGALTILPFFVQLDGAFPAVADYIRDFEKDQQTLILSNVQIASSDQNTHSVTASLEVSVYVDPNRADANAAIAAKGTTKTTTSKSTKAEAAKGAPSSLRTNPRPSAKA